MSSLLTLTAEEAAVWACCPTERRGDLIITCLGKGLLIMSATDPPLTADPRETTVSGKSKLNLFREDRLPGPVVKTCPLGQVL